MSVLFTVLFLIFLLMLVFGLINPQKIAKKGAPVMGRKRIAVVFGSLTVLFMILSAVTSPSGNKNDSKITSSVASKASQLSSSAQSDSKHSKVKR